MDPYDYSEPRRSGRTGRYIALLLLVAALFGGWSWFWYYAAGKAEATIDGWRAREAKAGRIYECGSQTIGGFPFRYRGQLQPCFGIVPQQSAAGRDQGRQYSGRCRRSISRRC